MSSAPDMRQLAVTFMSCLTAITSASNPAGGLAGVGTSILSYGSSDTGLTKQSSAFLTALSSAFATATTPSSSINSYFANSTIDARTFLHGLIVAATAVTSVTSATKANIGTAISNQITADTGLSSSVTALLTQLSSGIQTATSPCISINNILSST